MKNQKSMVAGIIIVLVIVAIVIFAVTGKKGNKSTESATTDTTSSTADSTSTDTTTTPAADADTSTAAAVTISNFAFSPAKITVKVGTTVTWTNNDEASHTVTADTASSDAPDSELFGKGETYSFTFTKAGTYAYHCAPHPNMLGTVVVTE